jgi:toxin ParE1/3/4
MTPFRFRARARRDVEAAGAYYAREAGAGVDAMFLSALDKAVALLQHEPNAGSPRWSLDAGQSGLRSWPLKSFPYLVFYVHGPRGIDVTRVLHTSRDIPTTLQD